MITVYDSQGNIVPYDSLVFSGGEVHVRLKNNTKFTGSSKIVAYLRSSEDIFKLLMVTDALKRLGYSEIDLVCPYFPYARQDRVCNPGEALGATVMAGLINAQGYRSVEIWDAHSDVSSALLDNCRNIHQREFLRHIPIDYKYLVAPDAGASKKVFDSASYFKREYVTATKHRNTLTGEIYGTEIELPYYKLGSMVGLIVDDICDGGRTFIELAKEMRRVLSKREKSVRIELYVTHGIFSRGFDELRKVIDHVYCANIWPGVFKGNEDFLTILRRD